ncbi:MAG TPA: 2'-5' RNA ligase family protein [Pseudonocardiaceae bacterium]|nr:2'-5' RNA ligase family protein [Pseudonocardiaceae bacterium]
MPTNGRTGLVIPVPAADGLLELVEARHPGSVRQGVPAHVSLLYPFVGMAELTERDTDALRELFLEQEPMRVVFVECYRRGGFVALRPSPLERLTELTYKTMRRWPDVVPYEGLYGDVEPHLTVALDTSEETALTIEQEVTNQLPISAELHEAWLLAFDGRWMLRDRFEFGMVPSSG